MITPIDDDLCYEDLPVVEPAEYYELGQCIRNSKPYEGEPEKMILEVHADKDYYLVQAIESDGTAGYRERLAIRDAHFYYEKV